MQPDVPDINNRLALPQTSRWSGQLPQHTGQLPEPYTHHEPHTSRKLHTNLGHERHT